MRRFGSHVKLSVIISSSNSNSRILWALKLKTEIPTLQIVELTDAAVHKYHSWRYKPELQNSSDMKVRTGSSKGLTKQTPRATKFKGNSQQVGIKYSTMTTVLYKSDKTINYYNWHVHSTLHVQSQDRQVFCVISQVIRFTGTEMGCKPKFRLGEHEKFGLPCIQCHKNLPFFELTVLFTGVSP